MEHYVPCDNSKDGAVGDWRRLASDRMSIMRVANSRALKRASFWRPWFRVDENSGLTGRKGTVQRSGATILDDFRVDNQT